MLATLRGWSANQVANMNNFDTAVFFLGKLCRSSHDWNKTGQSLRYASQGSCVECRKAYLQDYYQRNKEVLYKAQRQYVKDNPERIKAIKSKYRQTHKELLRQKGREYTSRPEVKALILRSVHRRLARKRSNHASKYTQDELKCLYLQFSNCCAYCGKSGKMTLDHFIPIYSGGSDTLGNIVPACLRCNQSKQHREALSWYKQQPFYSAKRWKLIVKHVGVKVLNGQLPLL